MRVSAEEEESELRSDLGFGPLVRRWKTLGDEARAIFQNASPARQAGLLDGSYQQLSGVGCGGERDGAVSGAADRDPRATAITSSGIDGDDDAPRRTA